MKTRALLLPLLLAALAGCQKDRAASPEPPPNKARSESPVVLTTTGQSTAQADRVMGGGKADVERLETLPRLEELERPAREPGAELRPALFLTFEARTKEQVVQAYAAMWKNHAGDYEVLVPSSGGWHHVPGPCRRRSTGGSIPKPSAPALLR